jgi:hypothetical protein
MSKHRIRSKKRSPSNSNLKTSLTAVAQLIVILGFILGGMALVTCLLSIGVDSNLLRNAGGDLLMLVGILVVIFGDKKLNVKGDTVLKAFDSLHFPAEIVKWAVGLSLVALGMALAGSRL